MLYSFPNFHLLFALKMVARLQKSQTCLSAITDCLQNSAFIIGTLAESDFGCLILSHLFTTNNFSEWCLISNLANINFSSILSITELLETQRTSLGLWLSQS